MRAIVKQTMANLRSHRLQSGLIVLVLLVAATLLTLGMSTLRIAEGAYDRLFQRTNGAHLWLGLEPERVGQGEAETTLSNLPGVEATTGAMWSFGVDLLAGEERLGGHVVREWPGEEVAVNRPLLVAGRVPSRGEVDAIVLDRNVAVAHELEVGESLDLLTPDGWRPLTISGFYVSTEFCRYPNCYPPRHYLAAGALAELGLTALPGTGSLRAGLRLQDPDGARAVLRAAEEALPAEAITDWYSWTQMRDGADVAVEHQRVLLIVFSAVAGLAAGFLIASTVGEAVRAQTRQIGLLKAVGFTRGLLALIYLLEHVGLALVASLGGTVFGSLLALLLLRPLAVQFGETMLWPPLWLVLTAPLSVIALAVIFTLWPVRRAVRLQVVEAIQIGTEQPRRRAARLLRIAPPLAVGLSDILSRPRRSILTALALGMAVLTMTAALTIQATFAAYVSDPSRGGISDGDLFLTRSKYLSDEEARLLISGRPEVAAWYSERWWGFRFPGEDDVLHARFRGGDLEACLFPTMEGRMFAGPDEVVVGYGLARERQLEVGDTLTILLRDEPLALRLVGTYREMSNLGRMAMMDAEILSQIQPEAQPFRYILKLRSGVDDRAVADALAEASHNLFEMSLASEANIPPLYRSLGWMMTALALTLGGIAAIGVFSNVWMGVQERRQEFGMLKAVGMTPAQVTVSVLAGVFGIAVIGYAIGLLVGVPGIRLLMDTVGRMEGMGPIDPPIDGIGLVLLLPGIVLVAGIGALIPSRRAGKTNVVDALRYE
jgi:putative ABC transport system permease protein